MIAAGRFHQISRLRNALHQRFFHILISEKVQNAISQGKPVVALESTIISHGMPFPRNLEIAAKIEQTVIESGATPATIAVINGVPKVGLDATDFAILSNKDKNVVKASTRDLAFVCSQGLNAATTVASTMKIASLAGIDVFATGGIGGVHRGAEVSMDISADLIELGRTPVTVVCAGIKSILDISKSLEVLETQGVPVLGYQTNQFPAFFTRSSGIEAPDTVQSSKDIAKMILINQKLKIHSGIVVAVPNPEPLNEDFINNVIASAVLEAELQNITGPKITPYILSRIEQMSKGKSLESNIPLVLNNAKVASEIATEVSRLRSHSPHITAHTHTTIDLKTTASEVVKPTSPQVVPPPSSVDAGKKSKNTSEVMVVGGAVVDIIGNVTSKMSILNTSNPGIVRESFGGVGRNIAEQLSRLGLPVSLNTAIGKDNSGRNILDNCRSLNIDTSHSLIIDSSSISSSSSASTACYTAIHDNKGELVIGIADMNIFSLLDSSYMKTLNEKIQQSKIIIADGNLSKEGFHTLVTLCQENNKPLFFEPTSDHKCLLPFYANAIDKVTLIKPNTSELIEMINHALQIGLVKSGKAIVSTILSNVVANRIQSSGSVPSDLDISDIRILASTLLKLLYGNQKFRGSKGLMAKDAASSQSIVQGKHIFVSMGKRGVLWCCPQSSVSIEDRNALNALKAENVVISGDEDHPTLTAHIPTDVVTVDQMKYGTNGAGDAFCAGLIFGLLRDSATASSSQRTSMSGKYSPNYSNIKMGLQNSRNWIMRK